MVNPWCLPFTSMNDARVLAYFQKTWYKPPTEFWRTNHQVWDLSYKSYKMVRRLITFKGCLQRYKIPFQNHKSAPSASVDCSCHWSRLSKRCERQSLKCNFENRARWSSNKYTYAMAMYYRLKIIDQKIM